MLSSGFLVNILDPRGRCNRRGLLIAALVMLAVEAGTGAWLWLAGGSLDDPIALAIKAMLVYAAISAAAQRLHDTGRSAWLIPWALLGIVVWAFTLAIAAMLALAPEQMQPGERGFNIVFGGVLLPMLAMLLWMHFAPGEPRSNRFGPVPRGHGFARRGRGESVAQAAAAMASA